MIARATARTFPDKYKDFTFSLDIFHDFQKSLPYNAVANHYRLVWRGSTINDGDLGRRFDLLGEYWLRRRDLILQ